jgi:lipoyl(octanoyl) transferase
MTNNIITFIDLGTIDYQKVWDFQEKLFKEIVDIKMSNSKAPVEKKQETPNYLIFCEHPHVYTLGKSGMEANMLINENQLKEKGAGFVKTNRGGDITYHGPGQIVGYPILDLDNFGISLKKYIELIEESIILTLADVGIKAGRLKGATGVWLDPIDPLKARKICAIGVKASRNVTMHGFAFNVNTNLEYFSYINPCGFTDKAVTSLQKEPGETKPAEEIKKILKNKLSLLFGIEID